MAIPQDPLSVACLPVPARQARLPMRERPRGHGPPRCNASDEQGYKVAEARIHRPKKGNKRNNAKILPDKRMYGRAFKIYLTFTI
jgi:hypothetical protein